MSDHGKINVRDVTIGTRSVLALLARIAELETKLADCAKTCGGLEYRLDQADTKNLSLIRQRDVALADLRSASVTMGETIKLRKFYDKVVTHWSCVPDDPRRRRHILRALLDAIEDAHDEVVG